MNLATLTERRAESPKSQRRWLWPTFFAAWTALVLGLVWWLETAKPGGANLLIALDQPKTGSWLGQSREWVESHVAVEWAYPWILLGPYVIWIGLKAAAIRRGTAWWLGLHLAAGTGFILASQALMERIDRLRPRSVWIQTESIVQSEFEGAAKRTNAFEITRTFSWPDGKPRVMERGGELGMSRSVDALPGPAGTNPAGLAGKSGKQIVVFRKDFAGAGGMWVTNHIFGGSSNAFPPAALASNLAAAIEEHLSTLPGPPPVLGPRRFSSALDCLAYAALAGLTQAVHFRRRLAEREKQAMLLESRLSQSQLRALQAQMQPHFLFNALNGIAMLVRRDPRLAEEMIGSLSELLRLSLQQSGEQLIPLRGEMEFLNRYLEIQEMRFGDRLRVDIQVDPSLLDELVPPLVLQPLVENAIRHGLEPSPNPGLLRIEARRMGDSLVLEVEDNGVGLEGAARDRSGAGGGLGIMSVRERLAGLYGSQHEFRLENKPAGGVAVWICIPTRRGSESAGLGKLPVVT